MEICRFKAENVPNQYYDRLFELTFGHNGMMWEEYQSCRYKTHHGIAFLAFDDTELVGWSLRWKYHSYYDHHIYVFVDPLRRREGIGAELILAASASLRTRVAILHGWDKQSIDCFTSVTKQSNKLIMVKG